MKILSERIESLEARIAPAFAAFFELSSLDGINGFKINGEAAFSGYSVSDAGDVNGDGFDDLLIGAHHADAQGSQDNRGAAYVVFGKAAGFSAALNLSALNGANGFKINGEAALHYAGISVSGAGDVNGDGYDDVLIGANGADDHGFRSGAGYVVFGKGGAFAPAVDLSALNGADGFKISGETAKDYAGRSVSAAGDVNGDGFDDVLIGAPAASPNGTYSGASYVVFGKSGAFAAKLELSALDGANGFKINGVAADDASRESPVSDAGDVNGDGFDDLLISAFKADPNGSNSGASYVVFGKSGAFSPTLELFALNGTNGFKINGEAAEDYAGRWVGTAGDVNGDGFGDLLIGAYGADPNGSYSGASYVVFGKGSAFSATLNLSTLNGANGFKINGEALGDNSGRAVSTAGDVNGDGFDDLFIGAAHADPNGFDSGASYVVFGKDDAFSPTLNLSTLNGTNGFKINGVAAFDLAGRSVSTAGDVNGDGVDDLLIGANGANPNGSFRGTSYVIFGQGSVALPSISIGDATVIEGDSGISTMTFPITLSAVSAQAVTVRFSTLDGTASAGNDYTALLNQTLEFAPGETTRIITVEVVGDTSIETDESFSVMLSGPTNATIADDTGAGTILDDDTPTPPLVRINDVSLLEGHTGPRAMAFTVTLSAESTLPVRVNFASADGTATAGADYAALTPGTLTFTPGETARTITVEVRGDITVEPGEIFSVVLTDPVNTVIEDGTGLGTILDDDVTLLGKQKATFVDVDGEQVTIKVSKGTLKVEDFTVFPSGAGAQLALVDFSGETMFSGANLKISAGTGSVDVGAIDASGVDLGKVSIKGDLGRIDAGNDADPKPGVRSLRLNSLGYAGILTQLPGGSVQSGITGVLKSLKLAGDIEHATLLVSDSIGAITIKGSVAHAQLLAGYDVTGAPVNADVSIGRVVVGGDWIASNLIAGVTAGADTLFGTDDDAPISGSTAIASRIASIVIKGSANGTDGEADHFGFVAEEIAAFKSGGARLPLIKGPGNDANGLTVGASGDLKVREVA